MFENEISLSPFPLFTVHADTVSDSNATPKHTAQSFLKLFTCDILDDRADLSGVVLDNTSELTWVERRSAHQCTINVWLSHNFPNIGCFDAPAVLQPNRR